MGRSKRKKAPGSNNSTLLPMVASQKQQEQLPRPSVAADTNTSSTPGRQGEVFPPFLQQVQGKFDGHRVTGNNSDGTTTHLPTITRGPEALRQQIRQPLGSSPLHRTPGNQAAVSKIEYLSRVATWATTNRIASLGAFYGERLASVCQSAGIPSPVLNSQCERCESVLLPGMNCSVTVATKRTKKKTRKKLTVADPISTANTVVHRCHFCKYRNRKAVTSKQDVKTNVGEAAQRAQMKDLARKSCQPPAISAYTQIPMKPSADDALSILVTPPGKRIGVLSPADVLQVDHSASSNNKKRKRKGWAGLKAISTSLQNREVPIPERLGFPVDFNSPLNPSKKCST